MRSVVWAGCCCCFGVRYIDLRSADTLIFDVHHFAQYVLIIEIILHLLLLFKKLNEKKRSAHGYQGIQ